jgi:hypothetical protein
MRYLCLCYYAESKFQGLIEEELEALGPACRPYDEALRSSGHLMLVGSLALPSSSRTVRPGADGPRISEGPFSQTPDPVGAFFIIEADDMDHAIEVAAKHPAANLGEHLGWAIEIRPIDMFDQSQQTT